MWQAGRPGNRSAARAAATARGAGIVGADKMAVSTAGTVVAGIELVAADTEIVVDIVVDIEVEVAGTEVVDTEVVETEVVDTGVVDTEVADPREPVAEAEVGSGAKTGEVALAADIEVA